MQLVIGRYGCVERHRLGAKSQRLAAKRPGRLLGLPALDRPAALICHNNRSRPTFSASGPCPRGSPGRSGPSSMRDSSPRVRLIMERSRSTGESHVQVEIGRATGERGILSLLALQGLVCLTCAPISKPAPPGSSARRKSWRGSTPRPAPPWRRRLRLPLLGRSRGSPRRRDSPG